MPGTWRCLASDCPRNLLGTAIAANDAVLMSQLVIRRSDGTVFCSECAIPFNGAVIPANLLPAAVPTAPSSY